MSDVEQVWGLHWRSPSFPRPLFPILYPHGQHYTEAHRALTGVGGFRFSYAFTQRALSQVRHGGGGIGKARKEWERRMELHKQRGGEAWETQRGTSDGECDGKPFKGRWGLAGSLIWLFAESGKICTRNLDSGWDLQLCCLDDRTVHQYGAEAGSG